MQSTVCLDARLLQIPERGSNERNPRGVRLFWMLQELEGHVQDSRMYGMGRSAEPRIVCPKLSFRSRLTFKGLIPGTKLAEPSPTIDISYGEVAMSFPYVPAELLVIVKALYGEFEEGRPIDCFMTESQYWSTSLQAT